MMTRIYVDDMRDKPDGYDSVFRSGEGFLSWLDGHGDTEITMLSLDHDMGCGRMDGYGLVKRLAVTPNRVREVSIHSMNPVGARNMRLYLRDAAAHGLLPALERVDGIPVAHNRGKG